MRAVVVLASALSLLGSGCQPSGSDSGLDHVLGSTRRAPKEALKSCRAEPTANPVLQQASQYATTIAKFVMERNPDTFKDVYAPENFCITVRENGAVNAFAVPDKREVVFYTGILEVLPTDSHVAAVMAHELAHVTMQHVQDSEADEVERDARWQTKGPALKQRLVDIEKEQARLDAEQEAVYTEQSDIEAAFDTAETAEAKRARAELDALFESIRAELDPIMMSGRGDYMAFINLGMSLAAPAPRHSLENLPGYAVTTSEAPEYRTLQGKVEAYNTKRANWIKTEESASPALAERYRALIARSGQLTTRYATLYDQRETISEELYALRKEIMGVAADNWREKEADDVGLELYLRAGLAPINFQGMFDVLNASEQRDAATCALQMEAGVPDRGTASHPSFCWRYYNAKVLEMSEHAAAYEPLVAKATRTDIVAGALENVKRSLKQSPTR